MTDRPSHLRSLFQNDWLSFDSSQNANKAQGKISTQFSRVVRPRLQSLIPPKDEVIEIAGSSFDWLTLLHTLYRNHAQLSHSKISSSGTRRCVVLM